MNAPCSECRCNPALARIRGCDGQPAPRPVDAELHNGVRTLFWNCPVLFIPAWCHKWYSVFSEFKRYPSAPVDIWRLPIKYRKATAYYEAMLNEQLKLKGGKGG